ncbi:unnamed protein product [Zymoseptoria tritici ST99CH_3D7]|uniref:GH64 domain-containing protein n=2 Tax=Zymoseptoria tritici TaxID=1047171 RepID=A0A1X7RGQ7_ZYMT9|nr:unnamed protein product [Zymoseptoria tritici ST99CH_3D7]
MYTSWSLLLAATATIFHNVAAAPPKTKNTVPVMPGGVKDIIITAENTLNATNPNPTPSNETTFSIEANSRLPLNLVNNMGGAVNAYITGLDPSGRIVFVQPNGQFFYPYADASYTAPREVFANIAIPLNTVRGGTTRIVLPNYISASRVWFAQGNLKFYSVWAGNGPGSVQPSFANPRDPSAGINWGFVELTNNAGGLYANLSYVDFVGLSLGMSMQGGNGQTRVVRGIPPGGVSGICSLLAEQQSRDGQPWSSLCQSGSNGPLRVVAPFPYQASGNGAFGNYWTDYVNQVWSRYTQNTLTIDTQSGAGKVACRVNNNVLTCAGDNRGYAKPTAGDIFGCNSGPFAIQGSDNGVHRAVVPRLCAAFNRGTLLYDGGNIQPNLPADRYYKTRPNNRYSGIVHQKEPDKKGYAFSYDDVNPTGGVDQSGTLADGNPQLLSIFVGGT